MKNNNPDKRSKKSLFDYYSKLARTILNSLSANISILDENGVILETNEAWKNFAMKNKMKGSKDSIGVNYLELCDATVGKEAKDASSVAAGIRSVIKGESKDWKSPAKVFIVMKPAVIILILLSSKKSRVKNWAW